MRMLVAPFVVTSTLGLFAGGVALLVIRPRDGIVLQLVRADLSSGARGPGRALRQLLIAVALVAGVTLAVATLPLARPWLHRMRVEHGRHQDIGFPFGPLATMNHRGGTP